MFKKLLETFKKTSEIILGNSYYSDNHNSKFRFNKRKASVHPLVLKLRNNEEITLTDINLMLSDLYNKKALKGYTYKFHEHLIKNSIFKLDQVSVVENTSKEVIGITFSMSEETYGLMMTLTIDVKDFEDVFNYFELPIADDKVEEEKV